MATTQWTGTKSLTASVQFGTGFWIFMAALVFAFIAWRAGWLKGLKKTAESVSQKDVSNMLTQAITPSPSYSRN